MSIKSRGSCGKSPRRQQTLACDRCRTPNHVRCAREAGPAPGLDEGLVDPGEWERLRRLHTRVMWLLVGGAGLTLMGLELHGASWGIGVMVLGLVVLGAWCRRVDARLASTAPGDPAPSREGPASNLPRDPKTVGSLTDPKRGFNTGFAPGAYRW
jgi:hypothetical protein